MDLCAMLLVRSGLVQLEGLKIVPSLLGRWILVAIRKRKFLHQDIRIWPQQESETLLGFILHYLIGGILGVGFILAWYHLFSLSYLGLVWAGLIYGFLTNIFPWLLMYPSMGFGFFGKKLKLWPRLLIFSFVNHLVFGIGLVLLLMGLTGGLAA